MTSVVLLSTRVVGWHAGAWHLRLLHLAQASGALQLHAHGVIAHRVQYYADGEYFKESGNPTMVQGKEYRVKIRLAGGLVVCCPARCLALPLSSSWHDDITPCCATTPAGCVYLAPSPPRTDTGDRLVDSALYLNKAKLLAWG